MAGHRWSGLLALGMGALCTGCEPSAPSAPAGAPPAAPVQAAGASWPANGPTTYHGLPLLAIPRLGAAPAHLTGDLSDPCWAQAASRTLVNSQTGEAQTPATEVKLFSTAEALYIGFQCAEAEPKALKQDWDMWARDEVEVFIEPAADLTGRTYHHLMVDSLGQQEAGVYHVYPRWFNQKYGEKKWTIAPATAAQVGAPGWTATIRIPWAALQSDGGALPGDSLWRLNLLRSRPAQAGRPGLAWAWSPLQAASFHTPARFGFAWLEGVGSAALQASTIQEAGPQLPNQGVPPPNAATVQALQEKIDGVLNSSLENRDAAVAALKAGATVDAQTRLVAVGRLGAVLRGFGEGNSIKRALQEVLADLNAELAKLPDDDPPPAEISAAITAFEPNVFKDDQGGALPYRLRAPRNVQAGQKYPLFIYLHGSGECGDDNLKQLASAGFQMSRPTYQTRYPCFILLPQCPLRQSWANVRDAEGSLEAMKATSNYRLAETPTMPMRCLLALIADLEKAHPEIDSARIYISGGSLGGFGTWEALMRRPELFAAAAPSAGGGDETRVKPIAQVPIWIFHGELDTNVKTQAARNMRDALVAAGGHPHYTEYAGAGHGIGDRAFDDLEFLDWLFAQRLAGGP